MYNAEYGLYGASLDRKTIAVFLLNGGKLREVARTYNISKSKVSTLFDDVMSEVDSNLAGIGLRDARSRAHELIKMIGGDIEEIDVVTISKMKIQDQLPKIINNEIDAFHCKLEKYVNLAFKNAVNNAVNKIIELDAQNKG